MAIWRVNGRYVSPGHAAIVLEYNRAPAQLVSLPKRAAIVFRRRHRSTPRPITKRRLACAVRALDRQAEAAGLFADHVRAEQPTPEERLEAFEENARAFEQEMRDAAAQHWRRARAKLRSLPPARRTYLTCLWNDGPYPKEGVYLLTFLRKELSWSLPKLPS